MIFLSHLQLNHHSQCLYINTSPPLTTVSNRFQLDLKARSGHVQHVTIPQETATDILSRLLRILQISLPIQVCFSLTESPKESCSSRCKIFSSKLTDFNFERSIAWVRIFGFPSTKTLCYLMSQYNCEYSHLNLEHV